MKQFCIHPLTPKICLLILPSCWMDGWMPLFSEWTLLVVERMLKPFEWMPKPFKEMLQFSERTLLFGEHHWRTPFERMSQYLNGC